jgi:hypothetical protein
VAPPPYARRSAHRRCGARLATYVIAGYPGRRTPDHCSLAAARLRASCASKPSLPAAALSTRSATPAGTLSPRAAALRVGALCFGGSPTSRSPHQSARRARGVRWRRRGANSARQSPRSTSC